MLRIHSSLDPAVPGEPWIPLLDPFFGASDSEAFQKPPFTGRLEKYRVRAKSVFDLIGFEQAQLLLFPYGWEVCQRPEGRAVLDVWIKRSEKSGLPLVVFEHGDLNHPLPDAVSFSFHQSLHRSSQRHGAEVVPPLISDPLRECGRTWSERSYRERPVVSFRGVSPPLGLPWGRSRLKEYMRRLAYCVGLISSQSPKVGYAPRTTAIRALCSTQDLEFRCKLLPISPVQWCCGYMVEGKQAQSSEQQRQDYLQDLWDSDYVLCVRGQGNYSLRLFETLAMGRIPVVIDTDLVLPFEEQIDWKNLVVWVEEKEIRRTAQHILRFHAELGSDGFLQRQRETRLIWEKWIEPSAFFRSWAELMRAKLQSST
jgi:hypothetical protein